MINLFPIIFALLVADPLPHQAAPVTGVEFREYIDSQIRWLEKSIDERLRGMNLAVDKAASAVDERLKGMNEFRSALNDVTGRLAAKDDLMKLEERIKLLELNQAQAAGRATISSVLWSGAVSVLIAAFATAWRKKGA